MNRMYKNKQGVTLVELLIYMLLSVILMTITLRFSRDNTVQSVRNLHRMRATQSVGELSAVIGDDMRRLGAKYSMTTTDGTMDTLENVMMDAAGGDSSSFADFTDAGDIDEITYRFAEYSDSGSLAGYAAVRYFVVNDTLYRTYTPSPDSAGAIPETIILAAGVQKFDLQFGLYSHEGSAALIDMPRLGLSTPLRTGLDYTSDAALTSGAPWVTVNSNQVDSTYALQLQDSLGAVLAVSLEQGKTYGIRFVFMPINGFGTTVFQDTQDTMALVFLKNGADSRAGIDGLEDLNFYPGPLDTIRARYWEINPAQDITVNMDLRWKTSVEANFQLCSLLVTPISDNTWEFKDTLTTAQKRRVKAVRMTLGIKTLDGSTEKLDIADSIVKIIPINNNGV